MQAQHTGVGSQMASCALLSLVILGLLSCNTFAASDYISRDTIAGNGQNEVNKLLHAQNRRLLQVQTQCSVNFQVQNYSIITSECKGPLYPANACCAAFVKFACPFAAELNDNTTDCASNMFNYINVYGRYPAGLFANECHGNSLGLPCPPAPSGSPLENSQAVRLESGNEVFWWVCLISTIFMIYNGMQEGCSFF